MWHSDNMKAHCSVLQYVWRIIATFFEATCNRFLSQPDWKICNSIYKNHINMPYHMQRKLIFRYFINISAPFYIRHAIWYWKLIKYFYKVQILRNKFVTFIKQKRSITNFNDITFMRKCVQSIQFQSWTVDINMISLKKKLNPENH